MNDTKSDFAKPQENNANDTPMSLALRQLQATLTGPLYWIINGSVILLAAMAGPYFTLERLSFPERLVFWSIALLGSGLLMTFLSIYAYRLTAHRNWNWALIAIQAGAAGIVPVMALLYLAEGLVTGFTDGWYDWVQPSSLFVSVAPPLIAVTLMVNLAIKLLDADPPATEPPEHTQAEIASPALSALHKKIPHHLGHNIVTVRAQDHYVEVTTTKGNAMILTRLSDAAAQLEQHACLRIHRSWLVNLSHVVRIEQGANGPEITMTNDQRIPVGRRYRAAFDEAVQVRVDGSSNKMDRPVENG
jgi:hypothetical protein